MSTGQLHRPAVPSLGPLILVAAAALLLIAGCGGQEENEPPAESNLPEMVPARVDSTAAGTMRAAAGDSQGPGTSLTTGVQDPTAENAALHPTAPDAQAGTTAAARSPFHRPQVRSGEGGFGLQLGSFRRVENAQAQAERLRKLGYKPALEVASLGGQTYHRVVLRGLPDRAEAERLGEHIRSQTGITYLIRQK